jgi:hypothetical protein
MGEWKKPENGGVRSVSPSQEGPLRFEESSAGPALWGGS